METKIISLHPGRPGQVETHNFLVLFEEFNKVDAIENSHTEKTAGKYSVFVKNFKTFLQSLGLADIPVEEVSIPLLRKFVLWLPKHISSCSKTHLAKHINRINKALDFAVTEGLLTHNPTSAYHIKRDKKKEPVSPEDEECEKWINHQWHIKCYQDVQDVSTFQMDTGLTYSDLYPYKTILYNNKLWIEGNRGKTGKPFYVPLWHDEFKLARDIHFKHKGKLPYYELHFYNRLQREMACILGIETYITSHKWRKKFATGKDQNGWSLSSIAGMLGNTRKVCEEHYIKPSKKAIENELAKRSRHG